jgi:hypothetical protein
MSDWEGVIRSVRALPGKARLRIACACAQELIDLASGIAQEISAPECVVMALHEGRRLLSSLQTGETSRDDCLRLRARCDEYEADALVTALEPAVHLPEPFRSEDAQCELMTATISVLWSLSHSNNALLSEPHTVELIEAYLDAYYQATNLQTAGSSSDEVASDFVIEKTEPLRSALSRLNDAIRLAAGSASTS